MSLLNIFLASCILFSNIYVTISKGVGYKLNDNAVEPPKIHYKVSNYSHLNITVTETDQLAGNLLLLGDKQENLKSNPNNSELVHR